MIVRVLLSAIGVISLTCGAFAEGGTSEIKRIALVASGTSVTEDGRKASFTFKYQAEGKSYYYYLASMSGSGDDARMTYCAEASYDGEKTYVFYPMVSEMFIRSKDTMNQGVFSSFNPLCYLYSFSKDLNSVESQRNISLGTLLNTISNVPGTLIGMPATGGNTSDATIISLPPFPDRSFCLQVTKLTPTTVTLDKAKSWFPIAWRKEGIMEKIGGKCSIEFSVKEIGMVQFGNGGMLYYPKVSKKIESTGDAITLTSTQTIDSIEINGNTILHEYNFDPAQAIMIHDLDSGTIIKVPK